MKTLKKLKLFSKEELLLIKGGAISTTSTDLNALDLNIVANCSCSGDGSNLNIVGGCSCYDYIYTSSVNQ